MVPRLLFLSWIRWVYWIRSYHTMHHQYQVHHTIGSGGGVGDALVSSSVLRLANHAALAHIIPSPQGGRAGSLVAPRGQADVDGTTLVLEPSPCSAAAAAVVANNADNGGNPAPLALPAAAEQHADTCGGGGGGGLLPSVTSRGQGSPPGVSRGTSLSVEAAVPWGPPFTSAVPSSAKRSFVYPGTGPVLVWLFVFFFFLSDACSGQTQSEWNTKKRRNCACHRLSLQQKMRAFCFDWAVCRCVNNSHRRMNPSAKKRGRERVITDRTAWIGYAVYHDSLGKYCMSEFEDEMTSPREACANDDNQRSSAVSGPVVSSTCRFFTQGTAKTDSIT